MTPLGAGRIRPSAPPGGETFGAPPRPSHAGDARPPAERLGAAPDLSELLRAARDGDERAREALVRATYAGTWTLALRLTGNEHDAGDVVQETYLRAHRALGSFRGEAQFTTWLYRITANCASTAVRKRRRARTEPLADDAPVIDRCPERDPEQRAATAADRTVITAALAELPSRLRQVIVLRDVYDLPHAAIAAELGISESAAKVRLHRARTRLRHRLDASAGGDGQERRS